MFIKINTDLEQPFKLLVQYPPPKVYIFVDAISAKAAHFLPIFYPSIFSHIRYTYACAYMLCEYMSKHVVNLDVF